MDWWTVGRSEETCERQTALDKVLIGKGADTLDDLTF